MDHGISKDTRSQPYNLEICLPPLVGNRFRHDHFRSMPPSWSAMGDYRCLLEQVDLASSDMAQETFFGSSQEERSTPQATASLTLELTTHHSHLHYNCIPGTHIPRTRLHCSCKTAVGVPPCPGARRCRIHSPVHHPKSLVELREQSRPHSFRAFPALCPLCYQAAPFRSFRHTLVHKSTFRQAHMAPPLDRAVHLGPGSVACSILERTVVQGST